MHDYEGENAAGASPPDTTALAAGDFIREAVDGGGVRGPPREDDLSSGDIRPARTDRGINFTFGAGLPTESSWTSAH